jgi:DNA-binding transcriptional regulator PaaX
VKARTELFLYSLLWTAEKLSRPTFRNLNESFEGWAYRSGMSRRVAELERKDFLERLNKTDRIYRLTSLGRIRALGGRDPDAQWSRPWDGWWRVISFDVPVAENRKRNQLRFYLRSRFFGLLQRSLWISPDPLDTEIRLLRRTHIDAQSLILLQAKPCGGEANAQLVSVAWDFDHINMLYRNHIEILNDCPSHKVKDKQQAAALVRWAQKEHRAWTTAVKNDPLLPKVLLPSGYQGRRAWQRRIQVFGQVGESVKGAIPS